jgi:hypothetical protein
VLAFLFSSEFHAHHFIECTQGGDEVNLKRAMSTKSFKFIILVATAALIASASAAVYYSILMQPSVTVTNAKIVFVQGNDWPGGSSAMGSNSTWVSLALQAYPNATLFYDQPLNISNTDGSSHTFRLRHVSISPTSGTSQVGNFTFFNFVVENTAGIAQASFNYTTSGNDWVTPAETSYMILPANTQWILYVETRAAAGANAVTANLEISVDVTQ